MYNNEPLIQVLAEEGETPTRNRRPRTRSTPCLPERLPNLAFLQREAEHQAPLAIIRQLRRSPSFTGEGENAAEASESGKAGENGSRSRTVSLASKTVSKRSTPMPPTGWKPPQQFEIFRAIERKDIMFL